MLIWHRSAEAGMKKTISNCISISKVSVAEQVVKGLYAGVTIEEVDTLTAETAATMTTDHSDYAVLAARISATQLHRDTKKLFSGKPINQYWYLFWSLI